MKYQIPYEGTEIEYTLFRKSVKYINLRINKKGDILVSAPYAVPFETINNFVKQKAPWIILHIAKLERIRQKAPWEDFNEGKTLYILGKTYKLCISNAKKNYVFPTEDGNLTIFATSSQTSADIYQTYLHWLKQVAIVKYSQIMDCVYPKAEALGISRPTIQVRNMKTLWGSCTTTGSSIRLNLQLIKAPERCIEQVMLHELLHFKHPGHNNAFYDALAKLMPDYKDRLSELELNYKDGVI